MAGVRAALLVHGAGGGAWEWNVWRDVFAAAGVEARAPQLQPAADGVAATTFEDYARQVRLAMQALPRPRLLAGASLGGLLALCCSDAADALLLVNPMPPAPWQAGLPARDWPDVVPWQREARLAATRRALPDADDATALFAFRHWRDESGRALRAAQAGIVVSRPACPWLCIAGGRDEDVPASLTAQWALHWGAELLQLPHSGHVGPLLGRDAAVVAAQALDWLSGR